MLFLIALIFLSKVSFGFIPGFPYQESFFIFQKGLHPFVNIFFNIIIGSILVIQFFWKSNHHYLQNRFFKFYLFIFCLFLLAMTAVQVVLGDSIAPWWLQISAALSACFTVLLFARVIPSELSIIKFITLTQKISVMLCYLSLILLIFMPSLSFKGGRFIGVFKHIPYMVTTATLACVFLIYELFTKSNSRPRLIYLLISLAVAMTTLILTGTRSALFAVILSYFLAFLFFPAKKAANQFIKVSVAFALVIATVLFGQNISQYAVELVRGESAVGLRAAQDGIASRFDEFERGYQIFAKSPIIGQGLLSKFGEINETDVGQYNANKDPHNILVSAGVIGGFGFIVLVFVGFVGLIAVSFKKLRSAPAEFKILAIYVLTHIPILFIYHVHLSLGGMADRFYWIVIGYMMINMRKQNS
ncbi:MAG: O-antigen ligase family protein [Bdellovibrionota bacterium]